MKSMSCPDWACLSLFVTTLSSMISCLILTSGLAMSTSTSGLLIWLTSPSPVTSGRYLEMQASGNVQKQHIRSAYRWNPNSPQPLSPTPLPWLTSPWSAHSSSGPHWRGPRPPFHRCRWFVGGTPRSHAWASAAPSALWPARRRKEIRYDSDLLLKNPCLVRLAAQSILMLQCWR